MSFNRTTAVTKTGLGDDQFDQLQKNQTGIGRQIQEGFTGADNKLTNVGQTVSGLGAKIDSAGSAINENTNIGFNNLSGRVDAYGNALVRGQADAEAGRKAYFDSTNAAIENNTGRILGDVGQVREDTQSVGTAVNEGFATTAESLGGIGTSISDLEASNQTNFDTLNTAVDTGFTDAQGQVSTGFADAQTNRDLLSSNILGGQGQLQDYLSDMSGRADVYYQGLAGGQADLTNNLSGLQTDFTDFRDTYDVNTNLSNQSRGEIQDTLSGGFNNIRSDMGKNLDATQRDTQDVQIAVDRGNAQAAQGQRALTRNFTKNVTDLAAGMVAPDQQGAAEQNDVLMRLETARSILASQGDTIDEGLRDQYTKLTNSFDVNGQLIRESVDRSGLTTRRQMDQQTNILLAQFDASNNLVGQSVINVNSLLQQMDSFGYSGQGVLGNRAPQQLVNRRAAVESGIMAREQPFFSTFG